MRPKCLSKFLERIGFRKATGLDGISSKILHLTKPVIVNFVNRMIHECKFRVSFLKERTVRLSKLRPVGILPIVSKMYDRYLEEQLSILNNYLIHICQLFGKDTVANLFTSNLWEVARCLRRGVCVGGGGGGGRGCMWLLSSWTFPSH